LQVENKILTRPSLLIATITFATLLVAIPLAPAHAASSTLSISPGSVNTDFGGSFVASVSLANAASVTGYDVRVNWDPNVLTVTGTTLTGTLLDPARNNVLIARQQVFQSIGFARYALVVLGAGSQNAGTGASLLDLTYQVNDPTVAGSTATASEYPSAISVSGTVLGLGAVTIPVTTSGASYSPPSNIGYQGLGCTAKFLDRNDDTLGISDPVSCSIVNTGTSTTVAKGEFSYISNLGSSGRTSGPSITVTRGQAGTVTAPFTIPLSVQDTFVFTGHGTRVITFNDGSQLFVSGASRSFTVIAEQVGQN
jgi:hypothetical protein